MQNTHLYEAETNLASGEQKANDLTQTKVDPYQDPAYNVPRTSPARHEGQPRPGELQHLEPVAVAQEDSLLDQAPRGVGADDSLVPALYEPRHQECLENDSDLDDDWD